MTLPTNRGVKRTRVDRNDGSSDSSSSSTLAVGLSRTRRGDRNLLAAPATVHDYPPGGLGAFVQGPVSEDQLYAPYNGAGIDHAYPPGAVHAYPHGAVHAYPHGAVHAYPPYNRAGPPVYPVGNGVGAPPAYAPITGAGAPAHAPVDNVGVVVANSVQAPTDGGVPADTAQAPVHDVGAPVIAAHVHPNAASVPADAAASVPADAAAGAPADAATGAPANANVAGDLVDPLANVGPLFPGAFNPFVNLPDGGIAYVAALNLDDDKDALLAAVGSFFGKFFKGVGDGLRVFIIVLKYPVVILLAAYLFLLALGYVVDTASESLAPVCQVFPGFYPYRLHSVADTLSAKFGNLGRKTPRDVERIDFPSLMAIQVRTLDQLLAHSAADTQLAIGVKQAELVVKDLSIVVKASNLTSKDVLTRSLEEFAHDAKGTGRELQLLSAKLYGAVDAVLAFDDCALRIVAKAQASGGDAMEAAVAMFRTTMSVLSSEVARVIMDATTVAARLDALEAKLSIIRALCEEELLVAKIAMSDVLSDLWTILGGNRARLQTLSYQVEILRSVDWYRTLSVAHVVATTETLLSVANVVATTESLLSVAHVVATTESLLSVEAELSELRDKLAAPQLAGETVPLEVHLASIERSARRIHEEKLKYRKEASRSLDDIDTPHWFNARHVPLVDVA